MTRILGLSFITSSSGLLTADHWRARYDNGLCRHEDVRAPHSLRTSGKFRLGEQWNAGHRKRASGQWPSDYRQVNRRSTFGRESGRTQGPALAQAPRPRYEEYPWV